MVRPIPLILGAACRAQGEIALDAQGQMAIQQLKFCVEQLPLLTHPNPDWPKEFFMACGRYAFAVSYYQVPSEGGRRILDFWSKVWPLDISNYTTPERFSLAVRETLNNSTASLVGVEKLIIYSSDSVTVTLANNRDNWTVRMRRFFAVQLITAVQLQLTQLVLCRDSSYAIPCINHHSAN